MRSTFLVALAAATILGLNSSPARGQSAQGEGVAEFWYLRVTPEVELFVHEVGAGEPVVVLHGGPGADHGYLHGIEWGLTDSLRIVFYDQRGSLRSPAPDASYTIQDHVRDLEALREALGSERIHLLAHSAGTTLAYHYLAAYPARVGALALIGAVYPVNGEPGRDVYDEEDRRHFAARDREARDFASRPALQRTIVAAGLNAPVTVRDSARLAVLRQFSADVYHVDRWTGHVPLRVNPRVASETQASIDWNFDHTALLERHPYPVAVLLGEYDHVIGPRGQPVWRKLADGHIPSADVIVIPRAGHNTWIDQPELVRDVLRDALVGGLASID